MDSFKLENDHIVQQEAEEDVDGQDTIKTQW